MQFKIYDVLASLIPGTLVLGVLLITLLGINGDIWVDKLLKFKDFSAILTSLFLVTSYLIGYIIHALGSWFEPILWFTWGGRPSELLLKNKSNRLRMYEHENAFNFLIARSKMEAKVPDELSSQDFKDLYQIAKNLAFVKADGSIKERISEFNNSYIFSRNILIAFLSIIIAYITWAYYAFVYWWGIIFLFIALLILWYRCRDKAFYYSREIITAAYFLKEKGLSDTNI